MGTDLPTKVMLGQTLVSVQITFLSNVKKVGRCSLQNFLLYRQQEFPRLSEAKIKQGIFVDPQIRELTKDKTFDSILNEVEPAAWTAFKDVCSNFLGKIKQTATRKSWEDSYSHMKQWGAKRH
jgi:hypothetical protein